MKMSRIAITVFVTLAIPTLASAGKPERDRQKEILPKVSEAKTEIKKACGCNVGVTVDWDGYKKADDMFLVPAGLDDVVAASKSHCVDDTEKSVFCSHVSTFALVFDANGAVAQKGKKISCGTASSTHCGDHQIKAILDKL